MQTELPSDEEFYDRDMSDSPVISHSPPGLSNYPSPMTVNPDVQSPPHLTILTVDPGVQSTDNGPDIEGVSPRCSQERPAPDRDNDSGDDNCNIPRSRAQSSVSSLSVRSSPSPEPTHGRETSTWSTSDLKMPDSVTDSARFPLCMDRFFHQNGLMQPREQDLSSLDANGKAWVMERPPLSQHIDGNTWSFVDECHAGITSELLKVLYFFDIVNGMSNHFHWNGFVVGTTDISGGARPTFLKPSYAPNNKDINGVMLSQFMESDESISCKGSNSGVDTGKLLSASELSSSGTVYTSLELFRISVSFTAAVFESSRVQHSRRRTARDQDDSDDEDEKRQAIFGVVTVTALRNVDTLRLIMVSL